MEKRGLIQVYTGDGKGKTTAGVGQAIRARGHGFKVCFVYFFKNLEEFRYGEVGILRQLGIEVVSLVPYHPHFLKSITTERMRKECIEALEFLQGIFRKDYHLVVLDEILIALRDGFLKDEEVLQALANKPKALELVLTGRGATRKIIQKADLVTEMKNIKHPFNSGEKEREGIEY